MLKCGECGYENMDGLDYCDGCGAKLGTAAPTANGAEAAPATPPPSPAAVASTEAAAADPQTAASAAPEMAAEGAAPSKAPTGEMTAPSVAQPQPAVAIAAPPPFKAKLAIIRGGRRGQEFELETGNNLVGRWDPETGSFPEVDLDADDTEAKISRKHALIRLDGDKITIEDIGSLNGTYVNRQPRLQPGNPAELKDGDEVIIGKTFLKLTISTIS
jgi:FHA domain-containing protein